MKIITYIILLLAIAGFSNCEQSNKETNMVQIPQDIIYIPDNTIKNSSEERGIDQLYFGELELSDNELKSFIDKNGLQELQQKKDKPFFNEDHSDISWWKPDNVKSEFAGSKQTNNWVKEILVSKNGAKYLVFFRVYSI